MIGKIIIGNNFGNLCRYALDDQDNTKRPVVLAASGVRSWSAQIMEEDFTDQQLLRPGLGRAVMHVALAWPPEETQQLSNDAMVHLALEYMDYMKIDPATTQWSLIRHHDLSDGARGASSNATLDSASVKARFTFFRPKGVGWEEVNQRGRRDFPTSILGNSYGAAPFCGALVATGPPQSRRRTLGVYEVVE